MYSGKLSVSVIVIIIIILEHIVEGKNYCYIIKYYYYYIDTDEIPGFFLLLRNHIFIARSEDAIFIFHV